MKGCWVSLLGCVSMVISSVLAAEERGWFSPVSVGGLYVVEDENNQDDIDGFGLQGVFTLPWHWGEVWALTTEFQSSAGRMELSNDKIHFLTFGPAARVRHVNYPLSMHMGIRPTLLSDSETPKVDIGGRFHFSSHIGFTYHFEAPVDLGLRYVHTSNAGTYRENPGLDVFLLEISYRF